MITDRLNDCPRRKAVLYAIAFWAFWTVPFMLLSMLLHLLPSVGPWWLRIGNGLVGTSLGFFVTWLFLTVERKSFCDVGLVWARGTLARFFMGVVIAGVIFTLMLGGLLSFIGGIWAFAATIVALSETFRVSKWRAFGIIVVSVIAQVRNEISLMGV